MLAMRPHDQGDREALDRPRAELEEEGGGDEGGGVGVEDRDPHAVEAVVDGGLHRLAVAQLLADALEDEHVGVHAHADGEDDAGDAGQGQGGAEVGHGPEEDEQVGGEGHDRVQAGEPVVDEHEDGEEGHAHAGGDHALADGIASEGRAHRQLLQVLQRGGQRARAQDLGQLVRLLGGEAARDLSLRADLRLDGRGGGHRAVEDDGQAAADVAAGLALELVRARPG